MVPRMPHVPGGGIAIGQTLPDGQPRLVTAEIAGTVPVLVSPVGDGGYAAPADAVHAVLLHEVGLRIYLEHPGT